MIKTEDMTDGLYYVKEKHGVEVGDWDSDHKKWNGIWGGDDTEVLAPVPSYEEWQAKLEENAQLKEEVENCEFILKSRESEIVKLKELLKECSISNTTLVGIMDWLRKSTIPEQRESCEKLFENTQKLQKQLDEVLK